MATARDGKSNLSKPLLQMKFMQRSAIRLQKEDYESEQQKHIDDEHWRLDLPELKQKESRYVLEPSYVYCEQLKFGRMSFKGFNPEVEKLMQCEDQDRELARAAERERELGVDDVEMAERYSTLIGTMAKKFTKKRQFKQEDDPEEGEVEDPKTAADTKKSKYSLSNVEDKKKSPSGRGRGRGRGRGQGRGRGKQARYF